MKLKDPKQVVFRHFPEDVRDYGRRQFIKRMAGGAAALTLMPAFGFGETPGPLSELKKAALRLSPQDAGDEAYWKVVKEHFLLRKDLIMLNAANLCPTPYPVQQAVFDLTRDIDKDPSSHNRGQFNQLQENARRALAQYLGADAEEIALVRNTSEGNNIVIGGLTYQPTDEVIIWDENHPTANVAWDVRAQRYGFTVKRVKVPPAFDNAEQLIKPFRDAITRNTKIICFSHLSNLSGIALPAQAICAIARPRGILTLIDGAQTFGSHVVDLHDIDCDFYTGSSHKWFMGPKEVGVLYVRRERQKDLWPAIIGVGYPGSLENGAQKFETLGQRDDARLAAMNAAVDFHLMIGKERIEKRIRHLAYALKTKLQENVPHIKFHTPLNPEFSGGVVVFHPAGKDLNQALNTLYQKYNIGCAVFGGDLAGIRMCPHIYNTTEQIDKTVRAVAELA